MWWTTAPQIVPGVLAEVCEIRAAGRSRFAFFRFFELFRWIDGKIDARFVIYVKNRPRGVFGRSLRSEKCMF